jgi:hypothetical protein
MCSFTPASISTITVSTSIDNFYCHEEELSLICKPNSVVVEIASNFYEQSFEGYIKAKKKTNKQRGRKPKAKPRKIRKMQGNGKYINSQTTFSVLPENSQKPYKLKLFRTGAIQIPGILKADLSDAFYVIDQTIEVLNEAFDTEPGYFRLKTEPKIVMMNYIWRIENQSSLLDLQSLRDELFNYAGEEIIIDKPEVRYNPEKYQGLLCKLKKEKESAFTTLKIFSSGKINATFKTKTDDVEVIKEWFCKFLSTSKSIYQAQELPVNFFDIAADDFADDEEVVGIKFRTKSERHKEKIKKFMSSSNACAGEGHEDHEDHKGHASRTEELTNKMLNVEIS